MNIWTDPYRIPERILGDDCQHPITEDTEETGNFDVDMPCRDSKFFFDAERRLTLAN